MPNQKDVAKLAGVSSASVSRYISDPNSVKIGTAKKIHKAIKASGYKLDYFAQSLKTGRSYHVGILLPGIGPFYWEILQGIQNTLMKAGYFSTIFYTRDIDESIHSSRKILSQVLNNKIIEGVIFFPINAYEDRNILNKMISIHENIVVVDANLNNPALDQVFVDNYIAGRKAADELLMRKHRKFIFLHGMELSYAAVKRKQGFCDRLEESDIHLDGKRIIIGDYTAQTAYQIARRQIPLLPEFTAVFAVNDSSAIGFLRAATEFGFRCPQDFSLIGFDNNKEFTPYISPSLTTFQQPLDEMGNIAAERLINRIEGNQHTRLTMLQTTFIERESLAQAPMKATHQRQYPG